MGSEPLVYLCLPTPTVGGAEKRFAGLWRHLHLSGAPVRLVAQRPLYEVLKRTPELAPLPDAVELFDVPEGERYRASMRRCLSRLHREHPEAIFHYVMCTQQEVQRFWSRRTLHSVTAASLSLYNWKGQLMVLAGAAISARVDVLEEAVRDELARRLPFKAGALSVTPNSFVDLEHYVPAQTQVDRLTFVGLFTDEKQAFRLARALPAIDAALKKAGIATPEFRFLGRETRRPGIAELFASFDGIDAKAQFDPDPRPILAASKVIFSVQAITNYPSKALLEGMAAGALPIVTDVGKTRRMVPPEVGTYVARDFTDEEIASACVRVMTLSEPERRARVASMRAHLARHFSIETMASYYRDLYRQLALL